MQAIGERLREARMRQGLDITEVEVATKIRAKYLRALENDEFVMLPGSTYVRSFLRTYAEYLGLDAQLLVEEFRAQHEPRGEGEMPALAPPARPARPGRERRGAGVGLAFGPGTLAVASVLLVLVVLAVIGLASGGGSDTKTTSKGEVTKKKKAKQPNRAAPAPAPAVPRSLKLKVVPAETTYLCLDDGKGTKLFEGTISTPQSFREKRMRILLGRPSARLYLNGKPVRFDHASSDVVSFSFSRTGGVSPLPPGQRPCT
jgi:transcriptional regulator with XRE-family HTH domain